MKIKKLSLRNFKGIKFLDIDMNSQNMSIYGDNATGKTTVYDAFLWLLFGKDSNNKKDFAIKTLDSTGKEVSGIDNEVSAILIIADKEVEIKRVYVENYTKKRGSAEAEFTGNRTDYYINEVPKKQKEFDEYIKSICDENILRILTSPTFFNEQVSWKEKREILLQICGDVSNEDIIKNNPEFAELSEILKDNSVSEHIKIISSKKKKVNEELQKIPTRIDEASRTAEEVDIVKISESKEELKDIENNISELENKIKEVSSGDVSGLEKDLRNHEAKLQNLITHFEAAKREVLKDTKDESAKIYLEIVDLKQKKTVLDMEVSRIQERFNSIAENLVNLREEYKEINSEKFTFSDKLVCPTCGQDLPEEKVKSAREHAFNSFKESKERKLSENISEGKKLAEKKSELEGLYPENTKELEETKSILEEKNRVYETLKKELEELENKAGKFEDEPEYKRLSEMIESLKRTIAESKESVSEKTAELRKELAELILKKKAVEKIIATESIIETSEKRIQELKKQQKTLGKEYEKLEKELFLCEKFIVERVRLLEEKVSENFEIAKFKLFQEQINSGISERCETMVDGVPYPALNNAMKINVGLDIINTVSKFYGFKAPVFVDNRESVVKLTDIDTQVISLIVSEKDKKLRMEVSK